MNFWETTGRMLEKLGDMVYETEDKLTKLDKPLNKKETGKMENPERMEPEIVIEFKCPAGANPNEFRRQLKGQQNGLNQQSVAENIRNRKRYEANGRDIGEGSQAQKEVYQKAKQDRISKNQKKGMSYKEAQKEAEEWIHNQNALHNPDQIAGGDPANVRGVGDARVNKSIGVQWKNNVKQLERAVNEYAKGKSQSELEHTKMNVKLVMR